MKIIAIHDGKGGHISQLKGVINNFSAKNINGNISENTQGNIETIQAQNSKLKYLPNFLVEALLFLLNKELSHIQNPNLIITIGKKSTPYAIYLKKKFPKAKLVFLMPSGGLSAKYGDLIFYHSYKNVKYQKPSKYVPILSAPHLLNQTALQLAQKDWEKEFAKYKTPITSIILGGDAKKISLNSAGIDDLVAEIKKIKQQVGGSFFITTSRRTGVANELYFKKQMLDMVTKGEISAEDYFFWGYHENSKAHEKEKPNKKEKAKNPYLAMLAYSKYVIISGESISMISEACSLPADVGVYIFFSQNFSSKRYMRFHENMYTNNHALPIASFNLQTKRVALNSTNFVVESIKRII